MSSLIPLFIGFQDQNSPDRALNFSPGVMMRKDSGETVRTNYMSYTGPAVPNVAKAAASNTTQKELKGKQPMKNPRKKGKSEKNLKIRLAKK